MQLSSRTGAGRLPALSGHLIDVSLDQWATSEYNLDRALQLAQETPQVLPKVAKGFDIFFPSLHVIYINSIQKHKKSRGKSWA
ncbi:MAG: hypothetical protein CO107_07450 [Deltaproteobacteria bacterium CG_4_9_14_3_um_filter_51_14]|nr:MAG: hypothetical protein CO107_07450 [Deltaproteobacteria bacterium CG_4_9_14_3_um_filter_51_14]